MKINGFAQQVNWQQIATEKHQKLKAATQGEALKKIREEQQFEIYKAKGKRIEMESVSLSKRINKEI